MRFAQIQNGVAHWIFEAEEKPQFAPNIVLVNITEKPEVQEGWDYNKETGEFTEPNPVEVGIEELSKTDEIINYVLGVDMRLMMIEMGL